ncbi:MAG: LPS export ABC transporter permease LptF [Rhodomicrobium sp.]
MLIARYIFRQTLSALIMILVSLTLIVWLNGMLRDIRLLTSQGQTFLLFLEITALAIPKLLAFVAPVAFLIASLHTLNRLNGDSELIVLSASGSSAWRLLAPYFALATIVFAAVLAANLYVLPPSEKLFNDLFSQARADVLAQVLQPREFTDLDAGLAFHMRARAENGDLLGVVVRDERDKTTINTIVAERGQIWSDGGRAQMDLHDGEIVRQQANNPNVQFIHFDTYSFDMGDFSAKAGKREPRVGELSMSELLHVDKKSDYYKRNGAAITSDIHQRLSTPLYSLVYALLAVVYLGRPRTTREGRMGPLFTGFMIGALLIGVGIASINLAGTQVSALWLVYGAPTGLALICALMLHFEIPAPVISLPRLRLPFRFAGAKGAAGGAA